MKIFAAIGLVAFFGLMLVSSHPVAAQIENVKLIEDERLIDAPAQPLADEAVIRTLVDQQNRGEQVLKGTEAFVAESGAAIAQPAPVPRERIIRLVIAQSGELAYEYGNYVLGLPAPESKAESFDGSYLRVWRKQKGEWLVDAAFARP